MFKKRYVIIIIIVLLILFIGFLILLNAQKTNKNPDTNLENNTEVKEETVSFDNLHEDFQKKIEASGYFDNQSITPSEENFMVTIANKYNVYIKNGFYMMKIENIEEIDAYCNIVDAIEMNLGLKKGESIYTCKEVLTGSINVSGIYAELSDNEIILTVNNLEPTSLYKIKRTYKEVELIAIDDEDYNIKFDNFTFSNMSITKDDYGYSVIGNIFNTTESVKDIYISLYDKNKTKITTQKYEYLNETKKYRTFGVYFENKSISDVAYYSISLVN